MSESDAKIVSLRALLAKTDRQTLPEPRGQVRLGHAEADRCLQGGLRPGALHEIYAGPGHGAAATGFTAGLCGRAAATKTVLWIRTDFSAREEGELAAAGWLALGLDPARLLLLRVADETALLRAGHEALSCGALGAVVMEGIGAAKDLTLAASQRLMLAGARLGVTAFCLRINAPLRASAAETRWQVRALGSPRARAVWGTPLFDAHLMRNRHGRTGRFALEWSADHGQFQDAGVTAHFGPVVSPSDDRSLASSREDGARQSGAGA